MRHLPSWFGMVLVGLAVGLVVACYGEEAAPTSEARPGEACAQSENDAIRLALDPVCSDCHKSTGAKPFFASLAAFEDLLVYDTKYVRPGKPEEGLLVELLEGRGKGAYTQMPIAGETFARQAEAGKTRINMAQIKRWITNLQPPDPARSGPNNPTFAR
jgi:hypothetical protein